MRGLGPEGVAGRLEVTSLSERAQYLLNKALAVAARPSNDAPNGAV